MLVAAEIVEDLELGGGEGELAVLVLAVEGDERPADVAQLADGGRAAVQVGARAPVGADATRKDDLLGSAEPPRSQRGRAGRRRPRHRPRSAPGRTIPGRGRPPSSRSSAWASTVLPAPVSPVRTFNPGPRRSSARSISRRFSTRSSRSMHAGLAAYADGSPDWRPFSRRPLRGLSWSRRGEIGLGRR